MDCSTEEPNGKVRWMVRHDRGLRPAEHQVRPVHRVPQDDQHTGDDLREGHQRQVVRPVHPELLARQDGHRALRVARP